MVTARLFTARETWNVRNEPQSKGLLASGCANGIIFLVKGKTKKLKKRQRVSHCHHHSPRRAWVCTADSDSGEAKAQKNWSEMVSNLDIRTESALQECRERATGRTYPTSAQTPRHVSEETQFMRQPGQGWRQERQRSWSPRWPQRERRWSR